MRNAERLLEEFRSDRVLRLESERARIPRNERNGIVVKSPRIPFAFIHTQNAGLSVVSVTLKPSISALTFAFGKSPL